ncbi:unnamed protein product [Toxocara canis]|uniref:Uncharacterized protein n=1 Tax=Toxocara canis TaxID=6265 RepID=A0A183U5Y7_TOXCA|nr:unnamed protein product [Toxocara canis]
MPEYTEMVAACRAAALKEHLDVQMNESSESDNDERNLKPSQRAIEMYKRYRSRGSDLSERAIHLLGIDDMATCNYKEVNEDKYDPVENPNVSILKKISQY